MTARPMVIPAARGQTPGVQGVSGARLDERGGGGEQGHGGSGGQRTQVGRGAGDGQEADADRQCGGGRRPARPWAAGRRALAQPSAPGRGRSGGRGSGGTAGTAEGGPHARPRRRARSSR